MAEITSATRVGNDLCIEVTDGEDTESFCFGYSDDTDEDFDCWASRHVAEVRNTIHSRSAAEPEPLEQFIGEV